MHKRLLVFLLVALAAQVTLAAKLSVITEETLKEVPQIWVKGKNTVVNLKGQLAEESTNCKTFVVQLSKKLHYQIDCAGHEKKASIDLKTGQEFTVTQSGGHTTITKYGFLTKKPQVSRLKQSTLKVPFVEEIIHLKKNTNGELSFYFESFRVDEFGRIVQDGFIQAHSLKNKKTNISAN